MYLYNSFTTSLPPKLSTFVADLVEMFPSGIYDTKFISTSIVGEPKSYLAYLYCKYSRLHNHQQSSSSSSWSIQMLPSLKQNEMSSPSNVSAIHIFNRDDIKEECSPSKKRRLREKKNREEKKILSSGICGQYSQHGWCKRGGQCPLSHDLEAILDFDLGIKKDDNLELNNSKNNNSNDDNENNNNNNDNNNNNSNNNNNNMNDDAIDYNKKYQAPIENDNDGHSNENKAEPRRDHASHFDAYMTAFIFCYYISTLSKEDLTDSINKLNLMRLKVPLRIAESHYSKPSEGWVSIKSKIWPTK
ncbi:unnamed protein product [Cunninghamella blakesleeana]